jgi:hypothetical protein
LALGERRVRVGHDYDCPMGWDERRDPVHRELQQTPVAHQRRKLLGQVPAVQETGQ